MTSEPGDQASNGAAGEPTPLGKLPLRLDSGQRVRREMARLYRAARPLAVDVADFSKLANMLSILHRAIENGEIERRVEALEQAAQKR